MYAAKNITTIHVNTVGLNDTWTDILNNRLLDHIGTWLVGDAR